MSEDFFCEKIEKSEENSENSIVSFSPHIHCARGFTNIGILTTSCNQAIFIDAGANEELAKPVLDSFKKRFPNHKLKILILTHAHSDHAGAANFLREQTGCEIWCEKKDFHLLQIPKIMSSIISGGKPFLDVQSDFYEMRKEVLAQKTFEQGKEFFFGGNNPKNPDLKILPISLPGHFFSQTGFLVEDLKSENLKSQKSKAQNKKSNFSKSVLFAADAIYGRSEVKKYWIPYNYDENLFLQSLKKIEKISPEICVPGHGNIIPQKILSENIELNEFQTIETENMILDILKTPKTAEQIIKEVADRNDLQMKTSHNCLIGSTLRSFLSCLQEKNLIQSESKQNLFFWKRKNF